MQRLLSYRLANLQGVGTRNHQEDSFVVVNAFDVMKIKEQGLFFAVCDGMGGMADGALASQTAVQSLKASFVSMNRSADLAGQLRESVYRASSDVESKIGGDGGSTLVGGIIYQEKLVYASVGDSFLYLYRGGNLYRMNREQNVCHSNYMEAVKEGSVDPSDYQEQSDAAALTGFLGMIGLEDIDCSVRPFSLMRGDVLLACSDGVGGVLLESDVKAALTQPSEQDICHHIEQRLVDYARANQDNYTAFIVKCV